MKRTLFILILIIINTPLLFSQIPGRRISTSEPKYNLLDMPGYKRAPIPFKPIIADASAAARGYKADSIYIWADGAGNRHRAKGSEILNQVNAMEKALNERGHSLREAHPFEGLTLRVPSNFNEKHRTIPPSFLETKKRNTFPRYNIPNNPPKIPLKRLSVGMGGYLFPYFGNIYPGSSEFPGYLKDIEILKPLDKNAAIKAYSIPVILPFSEETYAKIGSCSVELYNNEARTGSPVFTINIPIGSPEKQRGMGNMNYSSENQIPPSFQKSFKLYQYRINIVDDKKLILAPNTNHQYYYLKFSFTDKSGKALLFAEQNLIKLDNTIECPIRITPQLKQANIKGFNYTEGNQGFGFYIRSNGINATTNSELYGCFGEKGYLSFNSDFSIGVTYYNFKHLINDKEPATEDKKILDFTFSGKKEYVRPDAEKIPPPIRLKNKPADDGNIMDDPETKFDVTIMDNKTNSYNTSVSLFNQEFFIGPVPCFATIDLQPTVSVTANGTYKEHINPEQTNKVASMQANVTPNLTIKVIGSGGAGVQGLLWAKVVVGVNVIDVGFPINFDIKSKDYAKIDASAKIKSMEGNVSFNAGFCVPIPFFDDLCKDFTIPIASWPSALEINYGVQPDGSFK
ncbi:MAG: hypothetical protein JSU03_02745 [Bacteroidetes bacterium]|nr:hypothetical protein [Bacteroidota bacterium]MBS1756177.1 hypothetical protein [Bacteroidota bacterium]